MNKRNDSTAYKNQVAKFIRWTKEVDIIIVYVQRDYITVEECHSALNIFSRTVEEKKTKLDINYTNIRLKLKKKRWNGYLAPGYHFESGIVIKQHEEKR